MLVSSDKLNVTVPDIPPPINPSPAVTPVISPGLGAAHSSPVALALLTLRTYQLVAATVRADGVDEPLAEIRLPFAVRIDLSIKLDVSGATRSQAAPS